MLYTFLQFTRQPRKMGDKMERHFGKLERQLTTRRDGWLWERPGRVNGLAIQTLIFYATSLNKEVCSHDWRKRRENNRSNQLDNMELGQGPDLDNDIEKYQCCSKQFTTLRGLKIHQGKVCRKKGEVQQRRLHSHETSGEIPLDRNHNESKTTVEPRRKKIKWPKACDAA